MKKFFRERIIKSNLKVNLTDLSKVTDASPSQIRYWERKGYIKSEQDQENKNHKYSIMTVIQVGMIKFYLDRGYTLPMAVKKEHEHRETGRLIRHFFADRIYGITQTGKFCGEIDLGPLADDANSHVIANVDEEGTTLHLRKPDK